MKKSFHLLLSFFDEFFHGRAPVCCGCFSTKSESYSSEDGTLAAPVMPNDKVHKGAKWHSVETMALRIVSFNLEKGNLL